MKVVCLILGPMLTSQILLEYFMGFDVPTSFSTFIENVFIILYEKEFISWILFVILIQISGWHKYTCVLLVHFCFWTISWCLIIWHISQLPDHPCSWTSNYIFGIALHRARHLMTSLSTVHLCKALSLGLLCKAALLRSLPSSNTYMSYIAHTQLQWFCSLLRLLVWTTGNILLLINLVLLESHGLARSHTMYFLMTLHHTMCM